MTGALLLGLDGGFADTGFVLARYDPGTRVLTPIEMGLVVTKRMKSFATRVCDDNVLRAREITRLLDRLLRWPYPESPEPEVVAMCLEAMSYPRNAASAAKMMMFWGIVAALSERYQIPVVQAAPQTIKKGLTGNLAATKGDVQKALMKHFPTSRVVSETYSKAASVREHPFDALAALLACLEHDTVRAAVNARVRCAG